MSDTIKVSLAVGHGGGTGTVMVVPPLIRVDVASRPTRRRRGRQQLILNVQDERLNQRDPIWRDAIEPSSGAGWSRDTPETLRSRPQTGLQRQTEKDLWLRERL